MLNKLSYYLLVIVAIMVAACSDVEEILTPAPDQSRIMSFNIGNQTKVSTDDITSQEFIIYDYIYGAEGYTDGTCYIDGSKVTLKYRNGRWDFYSNNGDTRVDFLWTKTGEHRFYAFNKVSFSPLGYGNPTPVFINNGDPRLNIPFVDFHDNQHADLIYTSESRNLSSESDNKYSPVKLIFNHAFSSLLFEVKNEYDEPVIVSSEIINLKHRLEIEGQPYLGFNKYLNITIDPDTDSYQSGSVEIPTNETRALFGGEIICCPQGFKGVGPHLSLSVGLLSSPGEKETYPELYFTSLGITGLSQGVRCHNVITLSPLHFGLTVTNLERYYDGSDKKSNLTINLTDIAENDIHKIKNLTVTILDGSDNVVGSYTSDNVSSKTLTLSGCNDMPKGKYTIQYAYEDFIGKTYSKTTTFNAKIEEPELPKGKYIYKDGTRGDIINNNIVGVVIYDGNPKEKFNDQDLPAQYCNGLAISTKNVTTTWGGTSSFTVPSGVKQSPENFGKGGYSAKKILTDAGLTNLPIYVNAAYSNLSGFENSGWYLGTNKEWDEIWSRKDDINKLLQNLIDAGVDAQTIALPSNKNQTSAIWMPLLKGNNPYLVHVDYYGTSIKYESGNSWYYTNTQTARPIFAF